MAQKNLQKLLEKPMNRKEFLAHLGAGFLAIAGVSGLLKTLVDYSGRSHTRRTSGYGSSSYGGERKR